jgi:hypothetical protein
MAWTCAILPPYNKQLRYAVFPEANFKADRNGGFIRLGGHGLGLLYWPHLHTGLVGTSAGVDIAYFMLCPY